MADNDHDSYTLQNWNMYTLFVLSTKIQSAAQIVIFFSLILLNQIAFT